MPDMERMAHVQMLSQLMSTMPPQLDQQGRPLPNRVPFPKAKAAQWAAELVNVYGVRVHPELAVDKTLPDGVNVAGGAPRRIDDVAMNARDLIKILRKTNTPSMTELADRLETALGDPSKTQAMLESIRRENPDIMATARVLQSRLESELAE